MEKLKKKSFQCEICNSHFKQKHGLKSHISSVHEGKKPFQCDLCDYSCSQKGHMKIHVAAIHEKISHLNVVYVIPASH